MEYVAEDVAAMLEWSTEYGICEKITFPYTSTPLTIRRVQL